MRKNYSKTVKGSVALQVMGILFDQGITCQQQVTLRGVTISVDNRYATKLDEAIRKVGGK